MSRITQSRDLRRRFARTLAQFGRRTTSRRQKPVLAVEQLEERTLLSGWYELDESASGGAISNVPVGLLGEGAGAPNLAIAPDGSPVVGWIQGKSGKSNIYVETWTDNHRVSFGGSAKVLEKDQTFFESWSLALDPACNPIIAWAADNNQDGGKEIYLERCDGSKWRGLRESEATTPVGGGTGVKLAVGPDSNPVVAWSSHEITSRL